MDEVKQYAYKCKQCDTISPAGSRVCTKKRCGANLAIYGELGLLDSYGNWAPVEHTPTVREGSLEIRYVQPEAPQEVASNTPRMEWQSVRPVTPKVTEQPAQPNTSRMEWQSVRPVTPKVTEQPAQQNTSQMEWQSVQQAPPEPQPSEKKSKGSRKKVIIAIILSVLLVAGLVALIVHLLDNPSDNSSSKKKNSGGSTTNGICAPDFAACFPDDVVLYEHESLANEDQYTYLVNAANAHELVDEYVDYLTGSYPFEMTASSDSAAGFTYTGQSSITAVDTANDGTSYHIILVVGECVDDTYYIMYFSYAKEITLVAPSSN